MSVLPVMSIPVIASATSHVTTIVPVMIPAMHAPLVILPVTYPVAVFVDVIRSDFTLVRRSG